MPITVFLITYRNAGLSPSQFKSRYEGIHIPLFRRILGLHFSYRISHTRKHLQRSNEGDHPATVLIGSQQDFAYDAITEFSFEDEAHLQRCFARSNEPDAIAEREEDEEKLLQKVISL